MLDITEIKNQLEGLIDKNSIESITISSPIKKSEAVTKIKVYYAQGRTLLSVFGIHKG